MLAACAGCRERLCFSETEASPRRNSNVVYKHSVRRPLSETEASPRRNSNLVGRLVGRSRDGISNSIVLGAGYSRHSRRRKSPLRKSLRAASSPQPFWHKSLSIRRLAWLVLFSHGSKVQAGHQSRRQSRGSGTRSIGALTKIAQTLI